MPVTSRPAQRHHVTAVLIAHDGQAWLPRTLAALAAQTRQPHSVVAVDTGSTDDSYPLLAAALGNSHVIIEDRDMPFGQAVRRALRTIDATPHGDSDEHPVDWVWLLHDDCAPAPDALQRLLERADTAREAAVIGPKVRDWDHPDYLLEVGLTMDGAGHRHTGLERHELDQGQHDGAVDVLAVGSAGALIRRDVWDALGGYDERLPMFRDDIDFGWRANLSGRRVVVAPRAVVFHAQAGATGRRPLAVTNVPPRRLDRTHAMFTVLANASRPGLVIGVPRLAIVSLLRALLFLSTRRPSAARDEVLAYGALVAHPLRLTGARVARRGTRAVSRRDIRHLLPRRGSRLRSYVEHIVDWLAGQAHLDTPGAALGRPDEAVVDEASIDSVASRVLRRVVTAPGLLLFLALSALSLVAYRDLLGLHGQLVGGRLLPAPEGADDLWRATIADWHSTGAGVSGAAPPYLFLVSALSSVLFGKPWLAVQVLLLGAIPFAGLAAYRAAKRLTESRPLRLWAAASYALCPPITGAVAAGRIDVIAGLVLFPVAAGSVARALRPGAEPRRAWVAALAVTLAVAATPILYAVLLAAAALFVLGALVSRQALAQLWRVAVIAAVPLAVLAPFSLAALRAPALALRGAGPVSADALGAPRVWQLLVGAVDGPGLPPAWLYVPVVLAAAAAVASGRRRRFVGAAWAAALAALAVAVVVSRWTPPSTEADTGWRFWAGVPSAAAVGLLIAVAARAAEGTRGRFRRRSFSWRQPALVLVVAGALAMPMASALWLVTHSDRPVRRATPAALPAYVADSIGRAGGTRALVLQPVGDRLDYAVFERPRPTIGTADVAIPADRQAALTSLVRELASGPSDSAGYLTAYAIGFVVLLQPDPAVSAALDAQPGISRVPQDRAVAVWTVSPLPQRVFVLSAAQAALAQAPTPPQPGRLAPATGLDASYGTAQPLEPGGEGRLLVLAETADPVWRATLDGRALAPARAFGTQQAFVLPAAGGQLVISATSGPREAGRWLALAALAVVVVLAAPPVRLRDDVPGAPDDLDDDEPTTPRPA